MQADYSVELGKDDPALEVPWSADLPISSGNVAVGIQSELEPDLVTNSTSPVGYYDLKSDPSRVASIPEAAGCSELASFLTRINAAGFPLQTAKCDLWTTTELSPEEEIFGAHTKFASYVDLIFADDAPRLSLDRHESFAKALCQLLQRAPEMPASAEFVVRRCYFHTADVSGDSVDGFCITAYISGYADDQPVARQRWAIAIRLVQHALVQCAGS